MFDLSGKTALVTGATGGLGQSIAKGLHGAGATVILTGTREAVLAEVASGLGNDRVHVVPGNLSAENGPETLAKAAEEAAGQVDILVNNAGITRDQLAMRMKAEDWQQVLDVNLTAPFALAKALLRGMMKRRFGRIVGITSVVGVTGNPGQANYAAAKAGMIGMSKSLAQEVASRGITVNCVAPGFISTAMTDALDDKQRDTMLARIPAAAFGEPGDVAAAVAYLASPEAGYVTGQTIHVNGGMAMI
ncbi:MAG: 3-oxoacyl-[acyl-carrier-protein] reductase [Alphaproteobacteria bacterium]|nr:3-oxoacyl-[acyl-carrier-protein] reductase [Alphaproteobacteria bacterium SS10]